MSFSATGGRGRAGGLGRPRPCRRAPRSPGSGGRRTRLPRAGWAPGLCTGSSPGCGPPAPISSGASMRGPSAIRAAAWGAVVLGVAAPLVRRRLRLPPPVVTAAAAAAPLALCVAVRRSRARDVGVCACRCGRTSRSYQMPNDDPEALARRVRMRLPGARRPHARAAATLPGLRLQRALGAARGRASAAPRAALVWAHWLWFVVPHGTVAYMLLRRRDLFARGAARSTRCSTSASSATGRCRPRRPGTRPQRARSGRWSRRMRRDDGGARRGVLEGAWGPLYGLLGGNRSPPCPPCTSRRP